MFPMLFSVEHDVLEREIGRLRALYQQQQQPQQLPSSSHRRSNSRDTNSKDLDSHFANLSLKHKDSGSGRDAVSGPLHIWNRHSCRTVLYQTLLLMLLCLQLRLQVVSKVFRFKPSFCFCFFYSWSFFSASICILPYPFSSSCAPGGPSGIVVLIRDSPEVVTVVNGIGFPCMLDIVNLVSFCWLKRLMGLLKVAILSACNALLYIIKQCVQAVIVRTYRDSSPLFFLSYSCSSYGLYLFIHKTRLGFLFLDFCYNGQV